MKEGNNEIIPMFGTKPCVTHKREKLSFFDWIDKCERLTALKKKQIQCKKCKNWFWKDEL